MIVKQNCKISNCFKSSKVKGKCYHHQAIDEYNSSKIEPIVYDSDGSIHGIELKEEGRWVVGVQWHPERSDDDKNRSIFREFVQKAEFYRKYKSYLTIVLSTLSQSLLIKKA